MTAPDLAPLSASTARLLQTTGSLDEASLRAPSLLPGWSRAHVVAHLALNAEGLVRGLRTRTHREPQPVYDSTEQRDADIDALAAAAADVLLERLRTACAELGEVLATTLADADDEVLRAQVPRVPGGPGFVVSDMPRTRRREVEVHHVDLGAGYEHAAWRADFVIEMLDRVTWDHHDDGPFEVRATDVGRTWHVGPDGEGPLVEGPGAELAWWLSGRDGAELDGPLPALGPWLRRPD